MKDVVVTEMRWGQYEQKTLKFDLQRTLKETEQ